jgi:hypothetical protein
VILDPCASPERPGTPASSDRSAGFVHVAGVAAEGVVVALVVGIVAGMIPAWNGARTNVIEALRRLF